MSVPANAMMQMINGGIFSPGGAGMSVQPGTGMMAGGPAMQQPMSGGNPAMTPGMTGGPPGMGNPQASAAPNAMSQAQKMMMAQSLMNMGNQQQQPPMTPMQRGNNTGGSGY